MQQELFKVKIDMTFLLFKLDIKPVKNLFIYYWTSSIFMTVTAPNPYACYTQATQIALDRVVVDPMNTRI